MNDIIKGVTATGVSGAGSDQYADLPKIGEFLVTHGYGLLSYSEMIRIFGAIYLLMLFLKMLGAGKLIRWAWKKLLAGLEK